VRADSAFRNKKVIACLTGRGCRYSIGVTLQKPVLERIADIPEEAWEPVEDYPDTGICQLVATSLGDQRLIVRCVHLHVQEEQTELFAYWRHLAFVTNREDDMHLVDSEHRQHAECELAIRDLKDQALAHFPSGSFAANCARTVIACLAHNLQRRTGQLGLEDPIPRTARTIRRWLLQLPGRLTRTARRWTLHLPARWPRQRSFIEAPTRIRALPAAV
jgi:Transposase DDE domain group 1